MGNIVLAVNNGKITTTSNQIADVFGKRHDHVLRAIDNLECSKEFTHLNFGASEYQDATGRKLPCFNITRDGFVFLCMGFTGREAATWKEKYIAAFNAMEAKLHAAPSLTNHGNLSKNLREQIDRHAYALSFKHFEVNRAAMLTLAKLKIINGATETETSERMERFRDDLVMVNTHDLNYLTQQAHRAERLLAQLDIICAEERHT